jgi:hypothetical protein
MLRTYLHLHFAGKRQMAEAWEPLKKKQVLSTIVLMLDVITS